MNDIELDGVDPRRWAEARRRVAELRAWTAKRRHTKQECVDASARLGMTPKHFMTLVSAWKKHGDVARISGLGMRRGVLRGSRSLPAATYREILAAIETLGPEARFADVAAEAARRCEAASTPAASSGMVHYLLMRARRGPDGRDRHGQPEVLVGEVACRLPILTDDGVFASPRLVLAVRTPDTVILSHSLSLPGDDRAAAAREVMRETLNANVGPPVIVARNIAGAMPTGDGVAATGRDVQASSRSEILVRALGSHIDTMPIRHRNRAGADRDVEPATMSSPLSAADAHRAVRLAVEGHNRTRMAVDTIQPARTRNAASSPSGGSVAPSASSIPPSAAL